LSRGLHELSDEQCLAIAHDVRVVLVELADRLGQALKDEAEINAAINRLSSGKVEGPT
jgi:(p)ppGpp synthase/HD superfamily hydrolase